MGGFARRARLRRRVPRARRPHGCRARSIALRWAPTAALTQPRASAERVPPACWNSEVPIAVAGESLFALVADLPRYAEIEPHLVSARWLSTGEPALGSIAEVVADIPFAVRLVRAVIGSPQGTLTIVGWNPPTGLAGEFEGGAFSALIAVRLVERNDVQVARFEGVITLQRAWARLLLSPIRSLLEGLIARSIERGTRRVEEALTQVPTRTVASD